MSGPASPRATARIDLGRLTDNYRALLARLRQDSPGAALWCVVKADAYGHGAEAVTRALFGAGARRFCAATLDEARIVLDAAPGSRVLILGAPDAARAGELTRPGMVQSVASAAQGRLLRERARGEMRLALALDCGFGRLGLPFDRTPDVIRAAATLARLPGVTLDSIYGHLPDAEDCKSARTPSQIARFCEVCRAVDDALGTHVPTHLCATAGLVRYGAAGCDAARAGLGLYGYMPGSAIDMAGVAPVMTLTAPLLAVRRLAAGETVGYGGAWRAGRATTVGILPFGYRDGLLRACEGGRVLCLGHPVPLVGRVSMDACAVELGDLPAAVGDRCTIYDKSGKTLRELAQRAHTIPYELLALLGERVERRYLAPRGR